MIGLLTAFIFLQADAEWYWWGLWILAQIVEMLRNLQAVFYYNLEKKTFNPVKKAGNTTADMKAYRKEWYRNNRERLLKEKRDEYRKEKEKIPIK